MNIPGLSTFGSVIEGALLNLGSLVFKAKVSQVTGTDVTGASGTEALSTIRGAVDSLLGKAASAAIAQYLGVTIPPEELAAEAHQLGDGLVALLEALGSQIGSAASTPPAA
jgi:hypothetical protein